MLSLEATNDNPRARKRKMLLRTLLLSATLAISSASAQELLIDVSSSTRNGGARTITISALTDLGETFIVVTPWSGSPGEYLQGSAAEVVNLLPAPNGTTNLGTAIGAINQENIRCRHLIVIVHGLTGDMPTLQVELDEMLQNNLVTIFVIPVSPQYFAGQLARYQSLSQESGYRVELLTNVGLQSELDLAAEHSCVHVNG